MYLSVCVCARVSVCVHACTCVYIRVYACMCVHARTTYVHVCARTTYVHVCARTCMCVHVRVPVFYENHYLKIISNVICVMKIERRTFLFCKHLSYQCIP